VEQLHSPKVGYSGSAAYAHAKRALLVLTEQWADAWADQGIVVNAMHRGSTNTAEVESAPSGLRKLTRRNLHSPEPGADTMIWLAVATEAGKTSGNLFLDREPRSTHLWSATADDERERARLQPFLRCFRAPPLKYRQHSG
jgi:NAD(P)-dependent dehydrogenase (short-subunit alcohol dehydrogenase family)